MNRNGPLGESPEKDILESRLVELCRLYDVSLDLIERSTTPDELVERILDEYIFRFGEIPGADIAGEREPAERHEKEKIRSLVMFATQAVGLKESADAYDQLQRSNKELERVTQKLSEANQKLRSLNRHYLNMLGFVSHEIRSPLISILGFAELLQEGMLGKLNTEQANAISIIMRVSRELIAMVRNYLDLSKIESGELRLNLTPVDVVSEVIEPVLSEMHEQLARRKMHVVNRSHAESRSVELTADRELLKIVLVNLLSNAVKYGREGTDIVLETSQHPTEVKISVTNQGTGVSKNHVKKIFEKFTRGAEPDTEGSRGTGLGLFNSKWIVEAHRGRIWAECEYGEWFRVNVSLPRKGSKIANGTHSPSEEENRRQPSNGERKQTASPAVTSSS